MGARQVDEETIRRWISEGIGDSPGGSGLESYNNSAMSVDVMVYVLRDENDNIFEVYEPIRNNRVSYADSIDLFAFDSVNNYNNVLNDVKFIDVPVATKFQGCSISTMVIDANSVTGLEFINHNHKGNYGVAVENAQAMPHDAEIYITGNNVLFKNNTCQSGCWIDSLGDGCVINGNTFEASTWIKAFGCTNLLIDRSTFGAFGYILQTMVVDNLIVRNCQIDADGGFEVQDDDVTLNYCLFEPNCYPVFKFNATGSNFRQSCLINVFGGFANLCDFGTATEYTTVGDLVGKNYINIGGTTYLMGVNTGAMTLTAV